MAKAKKTRGKTPKKKTARRRPPKRTAKRAAPTGRGASAAGAAANKRIAELEAENQRLRDEITSLRGERSEEEGDRPPALEL